MPVHNFEHPVHNLSKLFITLNRHTNCSKLLHRNCSKLLSHESQCEHLSWVIFLQHWVKLWLDLDIYPTLQTTFKSFAHLNIPYYCYYFYNKELYREKTYFKQSLNQDLSQMVLHLGILFLKR